MKGKETMYLLNIFWVLPYKIVIREKEAMPISRVLQLSLCVELYSVDISDISRYIYIYWYHSIFLTTNNFFWLNQAYFVVLNVLHLLVCDSFVRFVLKFSDYQKHRSFLLCILLHWISMLVYFLFQIPFILSTLLYYYFRFLLIMWFLLLSDFLWTLLFWLL